MGGEKQDNRFPLATTRSHRAPNIIHLQLGSTETAFLVRLVNYGANSEPTVVFTSILAIRIIDNFESFVQANLQS